MTEYKKEHSIKNMLKDILKNGLSYISTMISANVFPPIAEGAEMVMKTIEKRVLRIEKKIMKDISSFLLLGFGSIFLIFSLFFFLIEFLSWTKAAAFFFISILAFIIGFLIKSSKN